MNNRLGIKDIFFAVLLIAVIVVGILALVQFTYMNRQIINLGTQLQNVNQEQLAQTSQLQQIISKGIVAAGPGGGSSSTTTTPAEQNIRETLPDGSQYVDYPNPPVFKNDPTKLPDYAPGDWLVDNLGEEPPNIIPFIANDYGAQIVQSWVLESLVTQDPYTLQFDPWLAESYRISADGLTITFKLRKNICFSDGSPITAQDVVFSYNTIMNPDVNAAPYRSYISNIQSCTAVGKDTVIFKFKQTYFLSLGFAGGMPIVPEKVYKKLVDTNEFNNPPQITLEGSGPYIFKEWVPGQQMVFVRNTHYWGEYPTFDRIVYRFILNPQAEMQSYLNGEIDYVAPEGEQWFKYTSDPDFVKHNIYYKYYRINFGFSFIGWNLTKPMFKDVQTRTALAMLVDREGIIKAFLYGMAKQVTGPFNPLSPQNDPTIKPLPYDPVGASKLLAQAGWRMGPEGILERNGQNFKFQLMIIAEDQLSSDIASYMKQQFAAAGIDMEIEPTENSVFEQDMDSRKFDAVWSGWSADIENDPYQMFDSASIADEGSNFVSYNDPEADKLMVEARTEMNDQKRTALWHQLQMVLYHDQPYMFLWTAQSRVFINSRFRNTQPYPLLGLGEPPGANWYVPQALQKYH